MSVLLLCVLILLKNLFYVCKKLDSTDYGKKCLPHTEMIGRERKGTNVRQDTGFKPKGRGNRYASPYKRKKIEKERELP